MKPGAKYQLFDAAEAGVRPEPAAGPAIPPGAMLVFDVELMSVKATPAPAAAPKPAALAAGSHPAAEVRRSRVPAAALGVGARVEAHGLGDAHARQLAPHPLGQLLQARAIEQRRALPSRTPRVRVRSFSGSSR